jgi:hypothetical protein
MIRMKADGVRCSVGIQSIMRLLPPLDIRQICRCRELASIRYLPDNAICTQRELIMVALSDLVFYFLIIDLHAKNAMLSLRRPVYEYLSNIINCILRWMLFLLTSSFGLPEMYIPRCPPNSIPPSVPCATVLASRFVACIPGMHSGTSSRMVPMGSETFLVRATIRLNPESQLHMTSRDLSTSAPSLREAAL